MIDKIFSYYGTKFTLICNDGERIELMAFLQPRRALSQRNALKRISPLGEIPGDTYLFICKADCGVQIGDTLRRDQEYYDVRQVETVLYKNNPLYLWGLCVQKGGTDTWDSQF